MVLPVKLVVSKKQKNNLPVLQPIKAKDEQKDLITIPSHIFESSNQNVVELEGAIVSIYNKFYIYKKSLDFKIIKFTFRITVFCTYKYLNYVCQCQKTLHFHRNVRLRRVLIGENFEVLLALNY